MITVTAKMTSGHKDVLRSALKTFETALNEITPDTEDTNVQYMQHDIFVLRSLLNYDVKIELSLAKFNEFTANHGVDFPQL